MQAFEVEDGQEPRDVSGSRSPKTITAGKSQKTFAGGKSVRTFKTTRTGRGKAAPPARLELSRRTILGYIGIVVCLLAVFSFFLNIHGGGHPPPRLVVSPRLREIAQEIFELYDTDHNNYLDVAELLEAVSLLGVQFTYDQMADLASRFNRGDVEMGRTHRGLTMPEFFRMLASLQIDASKEDLRFTFALLDREHANTISAAELLKAAEDVGGTATLLEMKDVIQEFDNGGDMLDFEEFVLLVTATLSRSTHVATILQRVLSDINMIVFFNRGLRKGGLVMVDATAVGTRLYTFNDYGEQCHVDIETSCSANDDLPLHGAAAIAYDQHECQAQVEAKFDSDETYGLEESVTLTISSDEQRHMFARKLLQNLATMHENNKHCIRNTTGHCAQANNRDEIPIMGTAGMRLLPLTSSIIVWDTVCGAKDPTGSYKFASKGRKCGTIPGTDEAWYEFIANVGQGVSRRQTATLSIGIRSAQIALPLLTTAEVSAFQDLLDAVKEKLGDCSGLLLPGGKARVPIFNKGALDDRQECYRDFVDMRDVSTMHLALEDYEVGGLDAVKAIGLISFLGVGTSNIAGGVEAIEKWASANDCGAVEPGEPGDEEYPYDDCKDKLDQALENDHFFSDVKKFFEESPPTVKDFNLHSAAATSAHQFLAEISGVNVQAEDAEEDESPGEARNIGEELLERVGTRCTSETKNSRWGKDGSMTCMKATYIALFLSRFFQNEDLSKQIFFTSVPWIAGVYHDMLGKKQEELNLAGLVKSNEQRQSSI